MKLVMIIGSHPRHMYLASEVAKTGLLAGLVIQKREPMIGEAKLELSKELQELYDYHFKLRADMEDKYFGHIRKEALVSDIPSIDVLPSELNGKKTISFIKDINADTIVSYGPDLFTQEMIELCPNRIFNIHGGLSPYYKGAATMFWPFYFLEPNYVGTTLHHISLKIDAGNIVHQSVPKLEYGDGMHEVACKAMVSTAKDLKEIVKMMDRGVVLEGEKQRKNGKLFLEKDWRPEHLRLIYEVYNDKIVDEYLRGRINQGNEPKLVNALAKQI